MRQGQHEQAEPVMRIRYQMISSRREPTGLARALVMRETGTRAGASASVGVVAGGGGGANCGGGGVSSAGTRGSLMACSDSNQPRQTGGRMISAPGTPTTTKMIQLAHQSFR